MQWFINSLQIGPKVFEIPPDASLILPFSVSFCISPSVYSLLHLTHIQSVLKTSTVSVKHSFSSWLKIKLNISICMKEVTVVFFLFAGSLSLSELLQSQKQKGAMAFPVVMHHHHSAFCLQHCISTYRDRQCNEQNGVPCPYRSYADTSMEILNIQFWVRWCPRSLKDDIFFSASSLKCCYIADAAMIIMKKKPNTIIIPARTCPNDKY